MAENNIQESLRTAEEAPEEQPYQKVLDALEKAHTHKGRVALRKAMTANMTLNEINELADIHLRRLGSTAKEPHKTLPGKGKEYRALQLIERTKRRELDKDIGPEFEKSLQDFIASQQEQSG